MIRRIRATLLAAFITLSGLTGCGGDAETTGDSAQVIEATAADETAVSEAAAVSAADAAAENSSGHEDAGDHQWDAASEIPITLDGSTISAGAGVTIAGTTATITKAGTYTISGILTDGQIVVDTEEEGIVRLVLRGVAITSSTSTPLYIASADEAMIILGEGTENALTDSSAYLLTDAGSDEPNAALFSAADLTFSGEGSLAVTGNFNDGIASKDGLIITGGAITVTAADDGIRGKDYIILDDGIVTVTAGGDGLKADNSEDATKGYIAINDGLLTVTAGGDAISAETDVLIAGGQLTLATGGTAAASDYAASGDDISAKGIKGIINVAIDGGTITVNATDDAIHSNGAVVVNDGILRLTSGDDGIHADNTLTINGGDVIVEDSYEGLESAAITIAAGSIAISASDDGINVAGGADGSGLMGGMGRGGGRPGGMPPEGMLQDGMGGNPFAVGTPAAMPQDGMDGNPFAMGMPGTMPQGGMAPGFMGDQDAFATDSNYSLNIHGGTVVVDATGDGLDSNGSITMTGGTVIVNGPTSNGNGALDYMSGFNMTGGLLVAAGSAGMAQAPDSTSTQNVMLLNFDSVLPAGTLIHIRATTGEEILTFSPAREFQSIVLSSATLASGATYEVYTGGSSTGTPSGSLVTGGAFSPGMLYTSFTVNSVITLIGSQGMMR